MDIYSLNNKTKTDIIKYKSFNIDYILNKLIDENNFDDAKIICRYVQNASSRNFEFIKWLLSHNKLIMKPNDIIFLCKNGLKKEIILVKKFININIYIPYCIQSNKIKFVKWFFYYFKIKKIPKECIYYCNNIIILEYIHKYIKLNNEDIIKYLKKLCKSGNIKCFIFIENYYNIWGCISELFKLSFIYNNYDILKYLIQKYPYLKDNIKKYYIKAIKNMSYRCIQYVHTLTNRLFTKNEYNNILMYIICSRKKLSLDFFNWYRVSFCNIKNYDYIIKILFQYNHLNIIIFLKKYIKYKNLNMYFINCCYNGNLQSIKFLYKKIKRNIVIEGFRIMCSNNHYLCVKWLYHKIPQKDIYDNLFKLVKKKNINIDIIKILYYKLKPVYPLKLPLFLCINDKFIWWIKENEEYFMNYIQYYLNIICYYGYFDTLMYIKKYIKKEHIQGAFISSCEDSSGYFISKWLYHNYTIDNNTIERALLYSNNLETIQWLYNPSINLRKNNNAYFIYNCINSNIEIVEWLTTIYNNYSYVSMDNIIIDYTIGLYIIHQDIHLEGECSICLVNKTNCITECNHYYCYDCINKWHSKNNTCPICRKPFYEIIQPLQPSQGS